MGRVYARVILCGGMLGCAVLMTSACGDEGGDDPPPDSTPVIEPDFDATDASSIQAFLLSAEHESWTCEPEPRASTSVSPHSQARVCFNPIIEASMAQDEESYPVLSTVIKELYSASDELVGFALASKVALDEGSENWVWFEAFLPDLEPVYHGAGIAQCAICHSGAPDSIFTPLP